MSTSSPNWFKEVIKDKITIDLQGFGGFLDGTMTEGDEHAGSYKFPLVSGVTTVYKLTGGIEPVPVSNPGLSTVTVAPEDFEASDWWRTQDAYKAGPSEQNALKSLMTSAIRRKRDGIKLDAARAFYDANTASIATIGTGSERVAPEHFEAARAGLNIYGDANIEDEVFCPIPEMWMSQLEMYALWNNTQYGAGVSDVFMKTQRTRMKKVRSINFIVCPDDYFRVPSANQWETLMWRKSAIGAETPYNKESPDMQQQFQLQGSPWLLKAAISGCAVGILPKGFKRLLLLKNTDITRP